jgi:hypothetical protein
MELWLRGISVSERPSAILVLASRAEKINYQLLYDGELALEYTSKDKDGAKRAAEALALYGIRAVAKQDGGRWRIRVSVDDLASGDRKIRGVVLEFVEELWANGKIGEGQYEELKRKLAGRPKRRPARAALGVYYNKYINALEIRALPLSERTYNAIVERLLAAGLKEGEHFIARPPQGGRLGRVYLRTRGLAQLIRNAADNPEAARLLEEIRLRVERLGEEALRRFKEIEEGRWGQCLGGAEFSAEGVSAKLGCISLERAPKVSLFLSTGGERFRYRLYYNGAELVLRYMSADRAKAEAAASMLKAFGVRAEAKRRGGYWLVEVSTDGLAAGNEALRRAVLEFVEELRVRGIIDEERYRGLRAKLEAGAALRIYCREGNAEIAAQPQNKRAFNAIVERLLAAGLKEGRHFTASEGYIRLMPAGLAQLIRNAVLAGNPAAAKLLEEIERGARKCYEEVKERVLSTSVKEVALDDGAAARVEVLGIEARIDRGRLRVLQRFRVDGVEVERKAVFYRYGEAVWGYMAVREDGLEADLRRLLAYCKAVGMRPKLEPKEEPRLLALSREDLEALMQFSEVAEVATAWLRGQRI